MRRLVSRSSLILSVAHDAFTALASVSDVIFDVLVVREFYQDGRTGFFLAGLAIFVLAQASYAFLFTATYASHARPAQRALCFVLAFPLAQLIPLFCYLETLELPWVQRFLTSFGLRCSASADPGHTDGSDSLWRTFRSKFIAHSGFLVEALVEAVPQCLLQTAAAMLAQHVSALSFASILLSILVIGSKGWIISYSLHRPTLAFNALCVSADVVGLFASVCWLCSNSPHQTLTEHIGLDTATDAGLVSSLLTTPSGMLLLLGGTGLVLAIAAGFLLLLFVMLDDALLIRRRRYLTTSPLFDVLLIHPLSWLLHIVPGAVLYASLKLSYLPLLAFRSLDPEHAMRAAFYRPLFEYLSAEGPIEAGVPAAPTCHSSPAASADPATPLGSSGSSSPAASSQPTPPGPSEPVAPASPPTAPAVYTDATLTVCADLDPEPVVASADAVTPSSIERAALRNLRVCAVNAFLANARVELPLLQQRLRRRVGNQHPDSSSDELVTVEWLRCVGHGAADGKMALERRMMELLRKRVEAGVERLARGSSADDEPGVQGGAHANMGIAALRRQMRTEAVVAEVRQLAATAQYLSDQHSECLPWLMSLLAACFPHLFEVVELAPDARLLSSGLADALLLLLSACCIALAAPLVCCWLVVSMLFLGYGTVYPLLQPFIISQVARAGNGHPDPDSHPPPLSLALSALYACLTLVLLMLTPAVYRFQRVRVDVVGVRGLPASFYSAAAVRMVRIRCEVAVQAAHTISKRRAGHVPLLRFGDDCTVCLHKMGTGSGGKVRELLGCGHAFHEGCLQQWLRSSPICPNCRSPAEIDRDLEDEIALAHLEQQRRVLEAAEHDAPSQAY